MSDIIIGSKCAEGDELAEQRHVSAGLLSTTGAAIYDRETMRYHAIDLHVCAMCGCVYAVSSRRYDGGCVYAVVQHEEKGQW